VRARSRARATMLAPADASGRRVEQAQHRRRMEQQTLVILMSVIMERPTCLLCLAEKTGDTKLGVVRGLEAIGETFLVTTELDERCSGCGSTLGPVFSLALSPDTNDGSGCGSTCPVEVTVDEMAEIAEAITGASVCSPCLVRRTGLTQWRVDSALYQLSVARNVGWERGRCVACLTFTVVHRLG
jgi:hypothetical protein